MYAQHCCNTRQLTTDASIIRMLRFSDTMFRNRDARVEGSIEMVFLHIACRWTLPAGGLRQLSQVEVCREKPQVKDEDSWLFIQGDSCVYCC